MTRIISAGEAQAHPRSQKRGRLQRTSHQPPAAAAAPAWRPALRASGAPIEGLARTEAAFGWIVEDCRRFRCHARRRGVVLDELRHDAPAGKEVRHGNVRHGHEHARDPVGRP